MDLFYIIALLLLWYVVGIAGYVYWWTSEFNLDLGDALFGLVIGALGIFTWPIGWAVHSKSSARILMKHRR